MTLRVLMAVFVALVIAPKVASTEPAHVFSKLPSAVVIGRHTYTVHLIKDLRDEKTQRKLDGACHYLTGKDDKPDPKSANHLIEIDAKLSEADKESTLFHEILHAVAHENGFPLSEMRVLNLESGLYEVFKLNGWKIKN